MFGDGIPHPFGGEEAEASTDGVFTASGSGSAASATWCDPIVRC